MHECINFGPSLLYTCYSQSTLSDCSLLFYNEGPQFKFTHNQETLVKSWSKLSQLTLHFLTNVLPRCLGQSQGCPLSKVSQLTKMLVKSWSTNIWYTLHQKKVTFSKAFCVSKRCCIKENKVQPIHWLKEKTRYWPRPKNYRIYVPWGKLEVTLYVDIIRDITLWWIAWHKTTQLHSTVYKVQDIFHILPLMLI